MRAPWLLLGLAACRQALGIPSGGTEEGDLGFHIAVNVHGATGAQNGAIVLLVQPDTDETSSEELTDATTSLARGVPDGHRYEVVPGNPSCGVTNGTGVAGDGASPVEITCNGLAAVKTFGFSAPLDFEPAFDPSVDSPAVLGSVLTQQTFLVPAALHEEARITNVVFGGAQQTAGAQGYGPFPFDPARAFGVAIANAGYTRVYDATPKLVAPAVFAYGKGSAVEPGAGFGAAVAASGDALVVGAPEQAGGNGRAFVFRRSGRGWVEEQVLMGARPGERFGASVALRGNRIVVGAPGGDVAGAAYVYDRGAAAWTLTVALAASPSVTGDEFGAAVAIGGIGATSVLVGAPSATASGTVFEFAPPSANAVATLRPARAGDRFGAALATSGSAIVIGAPGDASSDPKAPSDTLYPGAGAVWVYPLGSSSTPAYIKPEVPGAADAFGTAVAIDGTFLVVGAPLEDSTVDATGKHPDDNATNAAGAAYLFQRSGLAWPQIAFIKAPFTHAGDNFGRSVAILANTIATPATTTCVVAIGAPFENSGASTGADPMNDDSAPDAGAVFAYRLDVGSAVLDPSPGYLKAAKAGAGDNLGIAIALTPESLIAGAPLEDASAAGWNQPTNEAAPDSGAVYTFR
jgi:FG-GAP repeat protein